MTQIETERLLLRPLREGDLSRLAYLANRVEISHMLGTMPHPYSLADARKFFAQVQKLPNNAGQFVIALKQNSERMIGSIGYGPATIEARCLDDIDFGYWLGVDYWGKGYALEATRAVIAHAFNTSGIEQIDTDYLTINPASGRILEKLGFVDAGERTCHSCGSGETKPSRHMRLTREQYTVVRMPAQ
jgi:RimJ/RimL family protein N-acetyltransferase